MSDPERKRKPVGKALDTFDRGAIGKFQTDLYNLAYLRDQATKRNKIYLVIIIILIVSLVYICMTAKFKTYVVRVNDTTGEVNQGVELKARAYSPKQAEIQYFLREFIRNTRSVPNDMVVLRKNWERASKFMTQDALKKYNGLVLREDRTINSIRGKMIDPVITTLQLQPGMDRTYQIRWVEENFNAADGTQTQVSYSGLFTVTVEPPTQEAMLQVNPLGLMISDLTYQKENESVVKKSASQAASPASEAPAQGQQK